MKKIAISILNYKDNKDTKECIASLQNLDFPHNFVSIIIVNNGLEGKYTSELASKIKIQDRISIIDIKDNLGFSGGHNIAIQQALKMGADCILILNNDTAVEKNLLKELLKVAESEENIGVVVPKIYFTPGFEFNKNRYKNEELGRVFWYAGGKMDWNNVIGHHRGVDEIDIGQYDKIEETDFASGCCMLLKKDVFEKVGMLDGKYFLYYEDSDLSMRLKKAGYKIVYVPRAVVWHKNAGSAGGSGSKLQDYYITRNRLLFGVRYAPLRSKLALVKESLALFLKGRYWQRRGALDFYLQRFGKGSFKI